MRWDGSELGVGFGVVVRPRADLYRLAGREYYVRERELLRDVALLAHGADILFVVAVLEWQFAGVAI